MVSDGVGEKRNKSGEEVAAMMLNLPSIIEILTDGAVRIDKIK
jgi:hypothetical protein